MTESTPLKVLIAEDEPAMLSLVARHVRSLGFSVVEASEGDVAYELAKKHRPDLVILDVMMPGMSGWEICKRLKGPSSDGAFAKTGVIMLTGIGENLNDMTSPLFAADAWLNKPFDFNDLDAKIRETLDRYAKPLPTVEAHAEEEAEVEEAETGKSGRAPARKPAAKKAAAKKPAAKKPAAKKPVAKKPVAKKPAANKPVAKKAAKPAAKPAAKKAPAKPAAKPAAKKAAAKPAAKKPAAKKSTVKAK